MQAIRKILMVAIAAVTAFSVAGCGSSSSSDNGTVNVYKVEYLPGTGMNAPVQGKTVFKLNITKQSDGSPATGLSPALAFTMHMVNGDVHSTPIDSVTESGTPGVYDCTVYYMMASGPTMGTWDMAVTVNGETTTFTPDVGMAMGSDTVRALLYGPDDVVSSMSGTQYNKYYLFSDGPVSSVSPTFKLYLSHSEDMMMTFQPVSIGSVLSNPTGTVTSMTVQASTDNTFASNVVSGTDDGNGHWSLTGITDLATAGTYTIYVKLQVNGQDKTTDGAAASGTNTYQTFIVTSH
jgi:hypothetical protein